MTTPDSPTRKRTLSTAPPNALPHGHDLIAIAEWIPGKPPTRYEIEILDGIEYKTRYWRCRQCGQERTRPDEFVEACSVDRLPSPVLEGGYSVDDPRTRRALSEDMTVRFVEKGPRYAVYSESGRTYAVDAEAETCNCPDYEKRDVFCKHLRRVDIEIRTGVAPGPDGTFVR